MRRLLSNVLLGVTFAVGSVGLGAAAELVAEGVANQHLASHDNPIVIRGVAVRFDTLSASGASVVPRIHSDYNHQTVGITSVAADWSTGPGRGTLIVTGGPNRFVSIVVDEDETLTQRGINCGGSGGGINTVITCFNRQGVKVPVFDLAMYGPGSNLWLTWISWEGV